MLSEEGAGLWIWHWRIIGEDWGRSRLFLSSKAPLATTKEELFDLGWSPMLGLLDCLIARMLECESPQRTRRALRLRGDLKSSLLLLL